MPSPVSVYFVTGSFPPDVCGVGDYTSNLADCLRSNSKYLVICYLRPNWSFFRLLRDISSSYPANSVFHLQYPTEGFGYSLFPLLFFLFLRAKKVLTLHEFTSKSLLGKLYILALCCTVDHVIVSSGSEKEALNNSLCSLGIKKLFSIFPIPSNIPRYQDQLSFENRAVEVGYFGQIRPGKGLEDFISLCTSFSPSNEYNFSIIGSVPDGYKEYSQQLLTSKVLNSIPKMQIWLSESPDSVSRLLSNIKCLYLPFPDGFSLKRGSLLAGAINGCQIITTYPTTLVDSKVLKCLHLVENKDQALDTIYNLVEGNLARKNTAPLAFNRTFERCAFLHYSLYANL